MDLVLNSITELAELLDLNINDDSFKDKSPTNFFSICHLLLDKITKKENYINDRIETFENLINSNGIEEKNMERKKI